MRTPHPRTRARTTSAPRGIRSRASRPWTAFALALLLVPAGVQGQIVPDDPLAGGSEDRLVDRVAAVVGDSIILYGQVMEQMARMQSAGLEIPDDPSALAEFERRVLADLVDQYVLLQAADRDTLVAVSDDAVDQTFSEAWEDQIRRFGSEAELRSAVEETGQTLVQYRAILREEIRRNLLLQRFMQEQRRTGRPVVVEEAEVREFFERERERFGQRPATLTIRQVFLEAQPSDSVRNAVRERAEEILEMIRDGEDFATLAQRFSDDPGSRQQGGDLGWYRRGDGLVEEFEDAAFRLPEGRVSEVVESPFGAHVIRVDRVRGAERRIRHILVAAEPTAEDHEQAHRRAVEIVNAVRDGAALRDFEAEAARFGLPDSVTVPRDQLEQFPRAFADALRDATEGEVLGPIEFPLAQDVNVYGVVVVERIRDAGEYQYEDVRDQIRANLREQKFEERLLERLRAATYIDIRI
jgi:peptidyl-prolyl cis-trans isomerase SurA